MRRTVNFWNDIGTLERLARWAPYVFIVLGFCVAASGQFVRSTLDSRIATLKHEAETALKRTSPDLDAYLATSEGTGDLLVVIDLKNRIPIRCHWVIVTENNQVVSGDMMQDYELHPSSDLNRFKANIDDARIVNQFLELRLRFESIYSSELGYPPSLKGEVIRSYRFEGGHVFSLGEGDRL
jgi:hypothetical protein